MNHFEFWKLDRDGLPYGQPTTVKTVTGLILQCHPNCDPADIRHLAEISRRSPDYPVDITAWKGAPGNRTLEWSARIFWRGEQSA